ncbi:extracellular lipase esterase precursor [Companilactobacillus paralimentarius DSM 13238 = JCM 10415]|uniref:Extracellular lipase esterase n=1 Tax=Companilactobacillus paralimentarius DSM 13238 = JCM 10415 TaxID=1122151 RepID=A0A0R1PPD7_9LACO|nr:alpha/beta hydrolase [Companilactobacillus paralimentarius]KAE9564433.1 acyltransferase [Companilactobacillus paralimentarius]KRL30811.1 extracellular lipase esterase precursor [Companilactobacillus paralimentarius DSM 13238 = JCM 10415]QFR68873.1 alpha/beta hydrolase [Companilactobacillus paralimentarius]
MHTRTLRKNKNFKYLIAMLLFFIILGIPSYIWTRKNVTTLAGRYNSPMTPIIMIPGSSASANRFDDLVKTINNKYGEHHSILKLTVHTDDSITYSGKIRANDTQPFFVVGFQNNEDGYSNIKKQARWFNIAFNAIKKRYRFNSFNALGHSNGGLIWTMFLENDFNDSNLNINQLLTVGTPYNFEEKNTSNHTQMLNDLIKKRDKIPNNMTYYSIAGTQLYSDDGIVPLGSVDAGKYIYESQAKHYTLITLTGNKAQHSDMIASNQFITIFHQYIIGNGVYNPNSPDSKQSAIASQ